MKYRILFCFLLLTVILSTTAHAEPKKNVYVARFTNVSGDADLDWLSYFIADAIEKNLKVLPSLDVFSQTFPGQIKVQGATAAGSYLCELAKSAGAENVVGGDYKKEGDDFAVNAYIFRVAGGNQIGGASFISSFTDLYSHLNEISVSLAGALGLTYSEQQYARLQLAPTTSTDAMKLYGKALMEEPKSALRSQYLLQALSIDPSYTDALSVAGIYYYKTEKLGKAQELFEKLVQVQPDYPNAFYNLGLVLKARMFYTKAIEMYREALEKEQKNADAWNNIGVIYYLMGMYEQAREAFEQALQIQPDQKTARANLEKLSQKSSQPKTTARPTGTVREYIEVGAAFYATGDFAKAAEYFDKALQLQPDNFKANNNIALAYTKLGKKDSAIIHFKRALQADPTAIDVIENLEKLEGKPVAALPDVPQTPAVETPVALCAAGKIQLARRAYAEAKTSFLRALALAPNNTDALQGLGLVYLGQGEYEKARPQFEKVLALNPSHEDARKRLQDINYILADSKDSGQISKLPITPEAEARAHFVRGNEFYRAGKYEDAVGEYLRALDISPTNVEILNNLGTTYYTMGRHNDAKVVFKKAASLNPDNRIITDNLASLNLGKATGTQSDTNIFAMKTESPPAVPAEAAAPSPFDQTELDLDQEVRVKAPSTSVETAEKEATPFTVEPGDDMVKIVRNFQPHPSQGKEANSAAQSVEQLPDSASQSEFNKGVFKESEGDLEAAMLHYREAVKLEPENAVANYNLGNIYFRLGAFESAIECYVAAVKADPSFGKSYNNIGVSYYKLGKLEEAKSAWQKALQIDPTLQSARDNLNKYCGGTN